MKNLMILILVAIGLGFASCKKEEAPTPEPKFSLVGDWVYTETFQDGGTWHDYEESMYFFSDETGAYEIKINGTTVEANLILKWTMTDLNDGTNRLIITLRDGPISSTMIVINDNQIMIEDSIYNRK